MKDMQVVHHEHDEEEQKHDQDQRDDDENKDRLFVNDDPNPNNYETMNWEEEVMAAEDLLLVDDAALMSYGDFPPLPDFPCISSSSSSSSSSSCSSSAHPQYDPVNNITHNHHAVSCSNNNNNNSSSSSASSASSSASWAVIKPDHGEEISTVENRQQQQQDHYALLSTEIDNSMEIHQDHDQIINRMDSGDCMDVMEDLGEMDLVDTDDIWDPASLFPYEDDHEVQNQDEQQDQQHELVVKREKGGSSHDGDEEEEEEKNDNSNNKPAAASEDLALVFLEWLKSNKESISAEDLRSIKLKRSTIECAAQKLGGGKEGMKQLLKLILEWVQNHHLQKKRMKEGQASSIFHHQDQNPNPNFNSFSPSVESNNPCLINPPIPTTPWNINTPYVVSDPMMSGSSPASSYPPPPHHPTMHGFMGDPSLFIPHFNPNPNPYSSSSTDNYMLDSSQNWPPPPPPQTPHFALSTHYTSYPADSHLVPLSQPPPPPLSRSFSNYQNHYPPCPQMFQGSPGDGSLIRLGPSATKEARKKRMARQRRFFSHHQRHNQQHHQTNTEQQQQQQTRLVSDNNCTSTTHHQVNNNQANWVFWSSSPSPPSAGSMSPMLVSADGPPPLADPPPMQTQNYQRQVINMERRHGCKPEKNLKFLLQKVLKQSDVGNLGRIVLPKKEAETYLPELEARDGISIAMEDIGTSRIWNMRYRFWPNNKSRMYLLENTGDFVRSNGLQEGDFIVIYSDIKGGKYMIRGVKVRQPGTKPETKKSAKAHRNVHANSPACDGSSSSMIKQGVA